MHSKIATGIMLILVTLGAQACFQNVPLVRTDNGWLINRLDWEMN